jgi:hypothetical protein
MWAWGSSSNYGEMVDKSNLDALLADIEATITVIGDTIAIPLRYIAALSAASIFCG